MGKPGNTGLTRIIRATRYSLQGLAHAFRNEAAFRQELLLLVISAPLAFWLGRTPVERVMLAGSLVAVLIVELLNSAIEAAVDRHGNELHPLSGRAKDLGSAAVFCCLLLSAIIWATVAWQRFS